MNANSLIKQSAPLKNNGDSPASIQTKNEWARIPVAIEVSGLSRSTLYANFDITGGKIKTASIRKRGATRGIRMVNLPSLISWMDSFAESTTTTISKGRN